MVFFFLRDLKNKKNKQQLTVLTGDSFPLLRDRYDGKFRAFFRTLAGKKKNTKNRIEHDRKFDRQITVEFYHDQRVIV